MGRSSGPGQGAGAADTEASFAERLVGLLADWQRRVEASAGSAGEVSAVGREIGALRQRAQSRGWGVAGQLVYLEQVMASTPGALAHAIGAVSAGMRAAMVRRGATAGTVRLDAAAAAARGLVPESPNAGGGRGMQPDAPSLLIPPGRGISPPSLLIAPNAIGLPRARGTSPAAASSPAPPAFPSTSSHPPRVTPPPPVASSPPPAPLAVRSKGEATMASADHVIAPRPAAMGASSTPPPRVDLPDDPANVLPDSSVHPGPPPSLVHKTFLGLRAFRKAGGQVPPGLGGEDRPAKPGMFGFRALPSEPPRPTPTPGRLSSRPLAPMARPLAPMARPSRPPGEGGRHSSPSQDREGRRDSRSPRGSVPAPEPAAPRWFYVIIALVGLLGVATTIAIVVFGRHTNDVAKPLPAPTSASTAPPSTLAGAIPGALPAATVSSSQPIAAAVVKAIHERGTETPELRALLDMQSKLASSCRDDPATCGRGWTPLSKEALTPLDVKDFTPSTPQGPLPAWLRRLKIPSDLPVSDELSLRSSFDFNTKNIAGRQGFQARLFTCAAYADIFESTFIKYGAPTWLAAVVYQESGCNPTATSPVGARGLWQFMPESARMYGLRVAEGDVDERLNPIKATDAAVHFLTDLQRKLGSWDLVFAAYNMGPFAVVARLSQIGQNAGFWDLVHAHVLPEETAGYVPSIEAFALILENLSRLQFSRDGKRLESTAEIQVKPGARLSLLARAASTTTLHIRELNPEFLRDVVPEGETTARVPDAEAHRAETFLGSWSPDDSRDTCVPEDFDWGAKEFETSRFAKACAQARAPQ